MGGIGKTALGLTVIHHPSIATPFGAFRWFISCEDIFNAEDLKSALANMLKLNEKTLIPSLRRLASPIKSNFWLTLDNLETPWETRENQQAVEQLLLQLVDVPGLSLIVTLSGAERPFGIP